MVVKHEVEHEILEKNEAFKKGEDIEIMQN